MSRLCLHCGKSPASRPRGLCWTCYYTPGFRERFPPVSKFGVRGVGNEYRQAPMPPFPTRALPGTPEKIAVLAQRALLRQALWHPDDALAFQASLPAQVG